MVRQNLGNWKKKHQPIITTESWSNGEERLMFIKQLKERRRFPRKELVDVLSDAYTITDRQKKSEILETIGEILKEARDSYIPEDLMDLFRTTPDPETRRWIVGTLPHISNNALVPSIVQLFRHTNPVFRHAARQLLGKFDEDAVVEILAAELVIGTWSNRSEPLCFLNEVAPDKVVNPCRQALIVGNEDDRLTAISVLAELRSDEALQLMAENADDDSDNIRFLLASEMGRIPGDISVKTLIRLTEDRKSRIVVQALEGLRRLADESSLPAVIKCTTHQNARVRAASLSTIGEIGTADQIDLLINGIKDADIHIRQSAQEATSSICRRAEADGTKLLARLMEDDDVNVRRASARILGEINAPQLLEKVFDYLQDEDWWVRESIVNSLSKIKDLRVFPAAVELLSHHDPSLRRYSIDILINLGNRSAVMPIVRLLKDQDWWVREHAVYALGILGSEDVVPLLSGLLTIPKLVYAAAEALGNIGRPSAIRPLVQHLPKADSRAKIVILDALEKLHATSSIATLESYLHDPDRDVQIRAKEVLARLKINRSHLDEMSDRWWKHQNLSILDTMLMETRHQKGTDLFLVSQSPAMIRIDGDLIPISAEILSEDQILSMTHTILSPVQEERFNQSSDLYFSHEIPGGGRYRGNILRHSTGINMVFRVLPDDLPTLNSLDLPDFVKSLADIRSGLILVTGPPGSGKSSTVAALINQMNDTRSDVIITIEEPIEFVHKSKNCLIIQREVGRHTESSARALQSALREDPDVIMIGDVHDPQTLALALNAADAGHIVIASMDSPSASKTIERIINSFETESRYQTGVTLSETLRAVVSQQLVPLKDSDDLAAAMEILVNTRAVAALIRENKLFQIPSMIAAGSSHGMISMDQALVKLIRKDIVTAEDAYARACDKNQFEACMKEMAE